MFPLKTAVVFAFLSLFWYSSNAQTERDWLCGACRIMNFEIARDISSADDSKTTLGGSYRIDPLGNQKTKEKKFKRSLLHIHEVLDKVCNHMSGFGRLISTPAGKSAKDKTYQFVMASTAEGKTSEFVDRSHEVTTKLQHKCDDILEEHEDWLEEYFSNEVTAADADRELCVMRAGYCRMQDLLHSLYAPPIPSPKKEETPESAQEAKPQQDENSDL